MSPQVDARPLPPRAASARREPSGADRAAQARDGEGTAALRALAAELYTALGSPALPGYSRLDIHGILADDAALDPGFIDAMVTYSKETLGNAQSAADRGGMRGGRSGLLRGLVRRRFDRKQDLTQLARTLQAIGTIETQPSAGGSRDAAERAQCAGVRMEMEEAPFPVQATTAAQFAAGLRAVKEWSGLSLRQLEQQARQQGKWLPRSSIFDMLRRDSLPKAEALDALICALRLPPDVRDRWQLLRETIEHEGKNNGSLGNANGAASVASVPYGSATSGGRA